MVFMERVAASVISSAEQFQGLSENAIRIRNLCQTNFLMPDAIFEAAIKSGQVSYYDSTDCLCIAIRKHGRDSLYYWLSTPSAAFIPEGTQNISFAYFGKERIANPWGSVAEYLGLKQEEKALRHSTKTDEIKLMNMKMPEGFELTIKPGEAYSYDDYLEYVTPFFDLFGLAAPERWEWDVFAENIVFAELYNINGMLAAYQIREISKQRVVSKAVVALPEYRGYGLAKYLIYDASTRAAAYQNWVDDTNFASLAMYKSLNMHPDGTYQVFCAQ